MLPTAAVHALRNRFRVVSVPLPSSEITSIVVAVRAGTRGERVRERGVAHFTEHVIFKGGKEYPTALAMNNAIASIGGYNNAATNIEYTYYIIEVPNAHAAEALDIMADMIVSPRFPKEEFTRERKVVIDELIRAKQDDSRYIEILFEDLMYEHQPIGWDINGTRKNIYHLGRADVVQFVRTWYTPDAMACFLVGGAVTPSLVRRAETAFDSMRPRKQPKWKPFVRHDKGARRRHMERDDELTSIMLGFPALDMRATGGDALRALDVILGGDTSSRLYNRIREQRGLVYDIGSSSEFYSDAGHTATWAQAKAKDADLVERLILDEYKRLLCDMPTVAEVSMAKEICLSEIAGLPENHEALVGEYMKSMFFGGGLKQLSETKRRIKAIKPEDVRRIARRVVDPDASVCVTVGRSEDKT